MKSFSTIRARYREKQRLFAERALQQNKRRFVWIRGVLFWAAFGLVLAILTEFQQSAQQQTLLAWRNLTFLVGALLFCGFFGYLWANWKWKDYERFAKK
jgi:predicted outer membrane lipoprotein